MKKLLVILSVFCSFAFSVNASQMDFLMAGLMDNAGKPLAYGSVSFYVNDGGTTTKAVYASSVVASTNLLSSTLALNASGVPTYLPYGYGTYRVVWKDRYGATVKTATGVAYGSSTASGNINNAIDVRTQFGTNDAAIAAAIAYVGANQNILLFQGGEFTLATNQTFPTNIQVKFQHGAYWTVNVGAIATIAGNVDAPAGDYIFRGSGTVVVSTANNPIVYGNWTNAPGVVSSPVTMNFRDVSISRGLFVTGSINLSSNAVLNLATTRSTISGGLDFNISSNFSISGNVSMFGQRSLLISTDATFAIDFRASTDCFVLGEARAIGSGAASYIGIKVFVGDTAPSGTDDSQVYGRAYVNHPDYNGNEPIGFVSVPVAKGKYVRVVGTLSVGLGSFKLSTILVGK